jgi:amino acid adenylation domain-containing protein
VRTIIDLLVDLRSLDINIWAEGDNLHLNTSKGKLTPALRTELTERKAELIAFLREASLALPDGSLPIKPVSRSENLPLSFAQQRLWFLNQLESQSATYNVPRALCLRGTLNVAVLEQSLTEIVRRHEILRTLFSVVDDSPIQLIIPLKTVSLPVMELQELPELERAAEVQRLATEEARRPFDLEHGPLLRVTLLRLGATEHVLLVTMHHIVSDAWSAEIFIRELSTLYEAFLSGQPSPLSDLSLQYADFAVWQRQWLQGEVLEAQLTYWKQQLAGAPPVLKLPTDRPRPAVQAYRGSTECFQIDLNLTQRLEALSQQSGVTLFMTLLAAFVTLLSRYSGQEDIVVGSPIANRNRQEIEPLIGFFVNTLVLRTDLSGNPTFRELLGRVREIALGAYDHQDLPFERLVEALQPERNLSHAPLFQVMLVLQNAPQPPLELPGLTLSQMEIERGTAKFDLTLSVEETGQGLTGKLEYNTDLFEPTIIARMVGHFQTLLAGIVAGPEQYLSELPLLTAAERQRLLVEWNSTKANYPQDQCIHHLFEAQVERTPEAVAVVFPTNSGPGEGQQLTYRELNNRANQLAHYLRTLGVGPEIPVGLCVERSLEMIIGLLGILKAGGAYVPLDPTYPQERLAWILEDTHAPLLLTQERLVKQLPRRSARVVCLDANWEVISCESEENPVSNTSPENMVYVIYTSGSTGRPKGVVIQHRSVLNLWTGLNQTIYAQRDKPQLRISLNGPLAFDTSVKQWLQLLNGDTLYIVPSDIRFDGGDLLAYLQRHKLDVFDCTPSQLGLLLAAGLLHQPGRIPGQVLVGGEPIDESTWQVLAQATETTFYNLYGPTECTVDATVGQVQLTTSKPTIGRPLANTQIYILDRYLQPVPIGVPGEIYIGGDGLARGYLNRPDLTAERFIPAPFVKEKDTFILHPFGKLRACPEPAEGTGPSSFTLYKTGDLARYLPDGHIEFLGRVDHQVKIRGFRIELGEIEAVLAEHPDVQEVVVMVGGAEHESSDHKAFSGNKRLVAYIVAQEPAPDPVELRRFLKEKLPDYMQPSAFVMLQALPLTANGKVDYSALPAPDTDRPELEAAYVAPRNAVEERLVSIWADVLGFDHIGVQDNFFELGGHSLQAVQLISKMSAALQRNFSVKDIFLQPTIAALADAVGKLPSTISEGGRSCDATGSPGVAQAAQPAEEFKSWNSLKIERRPLLSLFAIGKIGPVDSAALSYLRRTKFTHPESIRSWFNNLPVCTRIIETSLGRTAVILLPRFNSELYADEQDLVTVIIDALEMARHFGARTVSLTGLIPSATNYGRAITSAIADRQDLPAVSTGHATTTATVVMTIKRILQEGGRDLSRERVGVLGLGSIGAASLRLMLKCLPHPSEIILCDLYSKLEILERIKQELIIDLGFQGVVRVMKSQANPPPEFYEATLIIGATNVPNVLDISRLKSGTMIVDDSGPHCFEPELAFRRFQEQEDILFTEGGVLKSPHPISELRYVPQETAPATHLSELEVFLLRYLGYNQFNITGCVFSSLLSSCFEDLKPTVGLVDVETSLQHYEMLNRLEFQAADLHCRDYTLAEAAIRNFRRRFGK